MPETAFQLYWKRLKSDDREKYEEKLSQNRNRVQEIRKLIYADKKLHEEHKKKMREKYAARRVSMHGPPKE
jgi:hypothetical protein